MADLLLKNVEFPVGFSAWLVITADGEIYRKTENRQENEKIVAHYELIENAKAIELPPHDDLIDRNEAIKHFKDLTCVYDMALKDCNLEKEVYPHIEALWRGKRAICDTVVKILSKAPVIVAATAKE